MSVSHRTGPAPLNGSSGVADPIGEADAGGPFGGTAARRADAYVHEVRRILARFGRQRILPAGGSLFDPADTSRHLYIVESGTIDISLPEDPARHPIASFHAGAIFLFDFGGYQVASLEAAEESMVIDLPFPRLDRLCRQEMDLRLLLRQCHAFDVKSFLDVCYPARSRVRLAHNAGAAEDPCASSDRREARTQFMIPLTPGSGSHFAGKARRKPRHVRRSRGSAAGDRNHEGET